MDADEIAIIGAGCRFPGADNLSEFWKVLVNGENHVKEIPDSRWNNEAFYNEDPSEPGKTYVRKAGLLKHHDKWDNRLFGISDSEASRVDPQQRYVLECVHMALEDGCLTRKQISGSNTGVIIGCMNNDYNAISNSDLKEMNSFNATGTSASLLSARVSYVYNLQGTCLTLDTACSSALVAIHLAIQAIKTGDCDMMICGGVSSITSPDTFVTLCKARMLSASGQCQSFCETADGYARGEGCGVVILKKLKAAEEDGNKIWGTIKTASNQDGSTAKPMTAPSADKQLELLQEIYTRYNINPDDIQYIEAHGTGTARGDPTELNALTKFFSSSSSQDSDIHPILVGSVKTNIGHTESAAGIAGLLKVLLMMKHGKYVPSLHVNKDLSNVNKKIHIADSRIRFSTFTDEWNMNTDGRRIACLNSFGFGGSNAHAIISQYPKSPKIDNPPFTDSFIPVCITGISKESLHHNLAELQKDLTENTDSLIDIATTSFNFRDIHPYRTLLIARDTRELHAAAEKKSMMTKELMPEMEINTIFVYCGVGTTWKGMCKELMRNSEVFRTKIHEIDTILCPLTGWKISDRFVTETSYDDPFLNHIAIFCVQVGLTEVWRSFGVCPDRKVGQSVGEVAAAYAAGYLSLEESVQVIYYLSLILSTTKEGGMAVIGNLSTKPVEDICKLRKDIDIAVYNSPVCCTISGELKSIHEVKDLFLEKEGDVFFHDLDVKCAYHSSLVESCSVDIEASIDKLFFKNAPKMTPRYDDKDNMVSTVTGRYVASEDIRNGNYWARNVRQPVMFMQAIERSYDDTKYNIFLEIGPRPVLKAHLTSIFKDSTNVLAVPSMKPNNDVSCLFQSMTDIFEKGKDVVDSRLNTSAIREITSIPRYHFNQTGTIFKPKVTEEYFAGFIKSDDDSHIFIQKLKENEFQILIDPLSTPFVFDHFLSGKLLVPGATFVEAGFHAGKEILKTHVNQLSVSSTFLRPFSPKTDRPNKLLLSIDSKNNDELNYTILHAGKTLANGKVISKPISDISVIDLTHLTSSCPFPRSGLEFYKNLQQLGFEYGDSLRLVQEAWLSECGTKCLTRINFHEKYDPELAKTYFHPAIIDSIFQIFGIFQQKESPENENTFVVPEGVEAITLCRHVDRNMYGYAEQVKITENARYYNAFLISENGSIIGEIKNFRIRTLQKGNENNDENQAYQIRWLEINNVPRVQNYESNKTILLTNDQKSSLKTNLEKAVDVVAMDTNNLRSLDSKDLGDYTAIVYHVATTKLHNLSDKTALEEAVERFLDLKYVFTWLNEVGTTIEVTIVTENTQLCPNRSIVNCNGSELWGMFRSAIHESVYRHMKIVDIDKENISITELVYVLFSPSKTQVEFALSGPMVFRSKLESFQKPNVAKRFVTADLSKSLELCSRNSTSVVDPFLLIREDKTLHSKAVKIIVDSLTLHDKSIYPTLLMKEKNCLSENGLEVNHILAIEGAGKIAESQTEILFLYPGMAENIRHVPQDFILMKKECPLYTDGCLILANTIVQLSFAVKDHSNVLLIEETKDDKDFGLRLFDVLMKRKYCNVVHSDRSLFIDDNKFCNIDSVILTKNTTLQSVMKMTSCLPNLSSFIALDYMVGNQEVSWIHCNFPNIEVTILSPIELLGIGNIRIAMPIIKDCLQELSQHKTDLTNDFLLKTPMPSTNFTEILSKETYRCQSDSNLLFDSTACYIIVGGLSGLGWEILHYMAEIGTGVLVTLSRRKPSIDAQKEIQNLETKYFCKIICLQADVTDNESVENAFHKIRKTCPSHPIKGIFHGAGVLHDSLLANLDEENVRAVLRPKIQGALNLHNSSRNLCLDYFVIHSSVVSVIGNPGQCNYAAGNSFLDSFVQYRRLQGLPAQCINWGPLTVGMAVQSQASQSHLEKKGFQSIDRDKIRQYFIEALKSGSSNIVYAGIVWEKLLSLPTFVKQSAKFSDFSKFSPKKKFKTFDSDEILKLETGKGIAVVKEALKDIIKDVLVNDTEINNDEISLVGLGLDSMAAMSLSNVIEEVFGYKISIIALTADDATISSIAVNVFEGIQMGVNASEPQIIPQSCLKFEHLFQSNEMTFMNKDVLQKCFDNRKDPYFLRVLDIEMSGISFTMTDWGKIVRRVLKKNPELRKRYRFSESGEITVELVAEDDPNLHLKQVPASEFDTNFGEDVRLNMKNEVANLIPVSFRVALSQNKTLLRIIHHAVAVDLTGLSLLCKDIAITAPDVVLENEEPTYNKHADVSSLIRNAILPKMDKFDAFWDNYLQPEFSPVSLGKELVDVNESHCCKIYVDVPKFQLQVIKKFISNMKITMYEFIMSLYQLYLHIGSKSKVVTIGSAADLRYHVPELRNVITRCTNYIPIIAHIDESSSILNFLETNSASISTTTQNGAFPSSLILDKLQNEDAKKNVFRHFLAMNDLTGINTLLNKDDYVKTTFGKLWLERPTRETYLYVRYDLQESWMKFEIGYNTEICGRFGEMFGETLLMLADEVIFQGERTIADIRDDILTGKTTTRKPVLNTFSLSQNLEKANMQQLNSSKTISQLNQNVHGGTKKVYTSIVHERIEYQNRKAILPPKTPNKNIETIITGEFQKQTRHGWDHKVKVNLNTDGRDVMLTWGKDRRVRKTYRKHLNVLDIEFVTTRRINGMTCVIIESGEKKIVFKTTDRKQVQQWMQTIQESLNNKKM